jgi:monoamine oxidase
MVLWRRPADGRHVGAGIAGMSCALERADAGIRSTVYEASRRIGGRMFSNTGDWQFQQVTEWCGELIDTGHTTIRRLAKRFDLPLDNLLRAQPNRSDVCTTSLERTIRSAKPTRISSTCRISSPLTPTPPVFQRPSTPIRRRGARSTA